MVIAFDAESSSSTYVVDTTLSWSHTCTGTKRILIVATRGTMGVADVITGVTYNSVAMTKLGSSYQGSSDRWIALWYLLNPSTGTNTITVSASLGDVIMGSSSSYTGVGKIGTTTGTATDGSATSLTTSFTTTRPNSWLVAAVGNSAGQATAGTGTAVRGSIGAGICVADSNAKINIPSSSSLVTNLGSSTTWVGIATELIVAQSSSMFQCF